MLRRSFFLCRNYSVKTDLAKLDRNRLVEKIRKARVTNEKLERFVANRRRSVVSSESSKAPLTNLRLVALRVANIGWDLDDPRHYGRVEDYGDDSVSDALYRALLRSRLVDDVEMARMRRFCGEVVDPKDADQVLTLRLKTNMVTGVGVEPVPGAVFLRRGEENEINYPKILNKRLPGHLRVIAWAPVAKIPATPQQISSTFRLILPGDIHVDYLKRLIENTQMEGLEISLEKQCDDNSAQLSTHSILITGKGWTLSGVDFVVQKMLTRAKDAENGGFGAYQVYRPSLVKCNCFDVFEWRYDPETVLDCSLHFQRLMVQFGVKASIVNQTMGRVDEILKHCDDCRDIVKMKYSSGFEDVISPLRRGYFRGISVS